MLAVWSWLKELVELPEEVDAAEGARALTAAGLEVESIETVGGSFSGVVVAEVVGKRKHPDADKLTLVDVIDAAGGAKTEVVCGAPNVPEPGGRVLWAKPGSRLPGGFEIGVRAIKGVSSAGMLCSERELELSDEHEGIIVLAGADARAELGADAAAALGLREIVFDVGAPANRPDAQGHLGLARELAGLLGGRLREVSPRLEDLTDESLDAGELVRVSIDDPVGCPRYTARVIDGLAVGPSPLWMQTRLRAVGVRPLWNLIDVTNYVMFELGQPLHAFDYAHVAEAAISVRRARPEETMKTLDDVERSLLPDDLLICDARGPVALAGVMGGLDSEVTATTTRVLLESASFEPRAIRRTSRRLGLISESSYRFERGVDPEGADLASARAAELLARLGGGKVARGVVDAYPRRPEPRAVTLRMSRAQALTGVDIERARAAELLGRIGLEVNEQGDDELSVTCTSARPDLSREVDLIEEVIRLHGFDKVPATLPRITVAPAGVVDLRPRLARRSLQAAGMSEAITYAFTAPGRIDALRFPDDDRRSQPLALRNPMSSEQSVMRSSLLANLLGAVARNLGFGVHDIALFEVGHVYLARGGREQELADEPLMAAGVLAGARSGWLKPGEPVDFFDAKGALERLLAGLLGADAATVSFGADPEVPCMHPGVCAAVRLASGLEVGVVGEIHPETRAAFGIDVPVFGFELDLSAFPQPRPAQLSEISRYPAIARDLSFFIDEAVPAAEVDELLRASDEPMIESVVVLEDYRDPEKVPVGKKGMLWSITYRSGERTLTDTEVDAAHEAIVRRVLSELNAERR